MNASTNKLIVKLTHVTLTLALLVFCSTATPELLAEVNRHPSASKPTSATIHTTAETTSATTLVIFHSDEGMPRAREDVEPVRTAVVPGTSYIPVPATNFNTPNHPGNWPINEVLPHQGGNFNTAPTYQTPPSYQPAPQPVAPATTPSRKDIDPQLKISNRYNDSKMLSFLRSASMQQLTTLYHEASRMIDSRHVNPPAYEIRMRAAINSVVAALDNESFLRANNVNPRPELVRQVQSELSRSVQTQTARNANEAVGVMQWASETVSRQLGIRREAVALEFVNGTLDGLDKYSSFMPQTAANAPGAETEYLKTASLEERIVGIGIEMDTHALGAILVGVVDNTPASELGLREGDIIVAVNQQSTRGLTLNEVASKMGGPAGTRVVLDIERNGQRFRGTVTRRSIYLSSVSGTRMIDNASKTGYVRLTKFSASSRKDLETALWSLHNQGMKSLILDLRGNPGGLLDQAIEVSNLFLPHGTIVATKGRNASDNSVESATYQKTWSVPLVVLIDDGSASASEILAAAVQDNRRGVVVGRQSYGKGTVQTHFPLQSVSGMLKLTTAMFYAPSGREMADAGVRPDVASHEPAAGTRGTTQDTDVQTAMNVIHQGTPTSLAQQIGQNRAVPQNQGMLGTPANQPASANTLGR